VCQRSTSMMRAKEGHSLMIATRTQARESRVRVRPLPHSMSDKRPHKAHHPSQSGKKAEKKSEKGNQSVSNERVCTWPSFFLRVPTLLVPFSGIRTQIRSKSRKAGSPRSRKRSNSPPRPSR